MSLAQIITETVRQTRALPVSARYLATTGFVVGALLLRMAVAAWPTGGFPYALFSMAVMASATLFDRGSGLLATALSIGIALAFFTVPGAGGVLPPRADMLALCGFALVGLAISATLEALHRALADLQATNERLARAQAATAAALDEAARAERARSLTLREFRHRTRNDLGSLAGLLMLRARTAVSPAARDGLREAAQHALALARVHTRLAPTDDDDDDEALARVDTRDFVRGLCADIVLSLFGDGVRSVVLVPDAEPHHLDAERAVPLGLVLNEAVTNALKYAFPEDRPGTVWVRFRRDEESFVLTVSDDGIGLPPEGEILGDRAPTPAPGSGLGTRLLLALAAQLRGRVVRHPAPRGAGTVTELCFPVRSAAPA